MDNIIKQLGCKVMYQAVKDFANGNETKRKEIINDLRSKWMCNFTNDMSIIVAEQLELHPDEITARILKQETEEIA